MKALPQRRPLRIPGYDYTCSGAYFVTLCVEHRTALLGDIVDGQMLVNDAGLMVERAWLDLPNYYPGVKVDICQIMPDHFHGILWLENDELRAGTGTRPYGLSDIIQRFKSLTTHQYSKAVAENGWHQFPNRLWQRSYYEHVIRNEQDLDETRTYIVDNPVNWEQRLTGSEQTSRAGTGIRPYGESGFTLIEMIVVIVIVGILSALGGQFIVAPVTGYIDLSRRTRLVDQAEMSLRRMQRDIRHALPNSIRIDGSGRYLEMLNTVDGGRYRRYQDAGTGDALDFTGTDTGFDILGDLRIAPPPGQHLVVYNTSSNGISGNAYAASPDNMAVVGTGSSVGHVNLTPGFHFTHASPFQRFFVVDQPITYACEGGTLNRYAGYSLNPAQPTASLSNPSLVARGISNCQFSYDPGANQRAGLVTLELSLSEEGETITLLHQVHVVNAP